MSSSLAYGVGVGGFPEKIDPHINLSAIRDSGLFKKNTYTNPLKRLSWGRRTRSKESSDVLGPSEEEQAAHLSTNGRAASVPSTDTLYTTPPSRSPTMSSSPSQHQHQNKPQPQTQISYHSLDSSSPPTQISAILSVSNTVFAETSPTTTSNETKKYSSLSTWQSYLSHPSSTVLFASIPSPTSSADVEVVGFIFAYPRTLSDYPSSISNALNTSTTDEGKEILHIWITAVLHAYRSQGIFAELMRLIEDFARENGIRKLSVATYPRRFARMYDVLKRGGWSDLQEEGQRQVDGEGDASREGDRKVYLVKDISAPQKWQDGGVGAEEEIGVAL